MKIRPIGAELFHVKDTHIDDWTDRQTGMPKLKVVFCNFAKAPN